MRRAVLILSLLATACAGRRIGPSPAASGGAITMVYVGTAAGEVLAFRLDPSLTTLVPKGRVAAGRNVTALASADGARLFAASEGTAELVSFAIRPRTGALTYVSRASARGKGTAELVVDRTGNYVLAANEGSGTLAVLPIMTGGRLGTAALHPVGPAVQGLAFHPGGAAAFTTAPADAAIAQFTFNAGTGILTPSREAAVKLPKGSGSRRLLFHPTGRYAYLVTENEDTVAGFTFEPTSWTLSVLAFQIASTLPAQSPGARSRCGDAVITPDGKFLYVVNRGPDTLAVFAIGDDGSLIARGHASAAGQKPRALASSPDGALLLVANQGSGSIDAFRIDSATGALQHHGSTPVSGGPQALAVARVTIRHEPRPSGR